MPTANLLSGKLGLCEYWESSFLSKSKPHVVEKKVLLDLETALGFQGLKGCLWAVLKAPFFARPWECPLWHYLDQLQEARHLLPTLISNVLSQSREDSLKAALWFCFQDIKEITHPKEIWVGAWRAGCATSILTEEVVLQDILHHTGSKTAFFPMAFQVFYCYTRNASIFPS